ncbi:MAG: Fic family protein [Ferruginibacter sp.]
MPISDLLVEIESNQSIINSYGKFDSDILKKINYRFRLDWNYYSNKMEGGTLTRSETRSVMIGNITVGGKPIKDILEMKGHDDVVSEIIKIGRGELRLSEKRIKEIHKAIMFEEGDDAALIGEWKKTANEIINYKSEKIIFTNPIDVPTEIHNLLNKTNAKLDAYFQSSKNRLHPLIIASDFHLEYITIHPFYDGNGRTARILMNLILISCNYPPIIIKEIDKNIYYQCLADIQVYAGDKNLFYEFCAKKAIDSQKIIISAIEGKSIEESDDVIKEIELLKVQLSDKDYTKSPKKIFTVFNFINDNIWNKIIETLKSFESFFNENTIDFSVNYQAEKIKVNNVFNFLPKSETTEKPNDLKIFGYSVYESNIEHVKWQQTLFGLRGGNNKGDACIYLYVEFEQNYFNVNLTLNSATVFAKKYTYSSFISMDEIEEMKSKLGKELIKYIKSNTGVL